MASPASRTGWRGRVRSASVRLVRLVACAEASKLLAPRTLCSRLGVAVDRLAAQTQTRVAVSQAASWVHSCLARRFSSLLASNEQVRLRWGVCWRSPAAITWPRRRAATLKTSQTKSAALRMRVAVSHWPFTTLPIMDVESAELRLFVDSLRPSRQQPFKMVLRIGTASADRRRRSRSLLGCLPHGVGGLGVEAA